MPYHTRRLTPAADTTGESGRTTCCCRGGLTMPSLRIKVRRDVSNWFLCGLTIARALPALWHASNAHRVRLPRAADQTRQSRCAPKGTLLISRACPHYGESLSSKTLRTKRCQAQALTYQAERPCPLEGAGGCQRRVASTTSIGMSKTEKSRRLVISKPAIDSVRAVSRFQWQLPCNARETGVMIVCTLANKALRERTCSSRESMPPGLSTRMISRKPSRASSTEQKTSVTTALSKVASANGRFSAAACVR